MNRLSETITVIILSFSLLSSLYATDFYSSGDKKGRIFVTDNVLTFDSLSNHFNFVNGNVGVENAAPSEKLDINGTLSANAMSIQTTLTASQFSGDGSGLTNVTLVAPDGSITNSKIQPNTNFSAIQGLGVLTSTLEGTAALFSGVVTASAFVGDGSSLTNISMSIADGSILNSHLITGNFTAITGVNDNFTGTDVSFNGLVSMNALYFSSTGNMKLGVNAGVALTTGTGYTFLGDYAGESNTEGINNTFVGVNAGRTNTTASNNTYIGYNSGTLSTGSDNTFLGSESGASNTTGARNTFIGKSSGESNTTGSNNTFLGHYSGANNTTGFNNTFAGVNAGKQNTTGINNTYFGRKAGYTSSNSPSANLAVGVEAGYSLSGGIYNTFLGYRSAYAITSGNYNVGMGAESLYSLTTGHRNTAMGYQAGYNLTTGSDNLFIGYQAGYNVTTSSNLLYIESGSSDSPLIYGEFDTDLLRLNATLNVTTQLIIGVTSNADAELLVVGDIEYSGTLTDVSDKKFKKNILPIRDSLAKVMLLRPRSFFWKQNAYPDMKFKSGRDLGFIAQELETVFPELVQTGKNGYKRIETKKLIAPVIESIKGLFQIQNNEYDQLEFEINRLQERNRELKKLISDAAERVSRLESKQGAAK